MALTYDRCMTCRKDLPPGEVFCPFDPEHYTITLPFEEKNRDR